MCHNILRVSLWVQWIRRGRTARSTRRRPRAEWSWPQSRYDRCDRSDRAVTVYAQCLSTFRLSRGPCRSGTVLTVQLRLAARPRARPAAAMCRDAHDTRANLDYGLGRRTPTSVLASAGCARRCAAQRWVSPDAAPAGLSQTSGTSLVPYACETCRMSTRQYTLATGIARCRSVGRVSGVALCGRLSVSLAASTLDTARPLERGASRRPA